MLVHRLLTLVLRNRAGRGLYVMYDSLDRHHAPVAASAMAFDTFLGLVPLTALVGYVLAHLHETGDILVAPILRAVPGPAEDLLRTTFLRLSDTSAALTTISLGAFLWVSSSGLSTAMYVFETVYHSAPRPWWLRRIIAMGCVIGGVAGVALVIGLALLVATLTGNLGGQVLAFTLPLLVVVGMLMIFFRVAIRGPRPLKRRIVPGALTTVVLWGIASVAFSFYVTTLARYSTLYGGLASVAIFLFWLWLLALALLVGGEVNAILEGIRPDAPTAESLHAPVPKNAGAAPPSGEKGAA